MSKRLGARQTADGRTVVDLPPDWTGTEIRFELDARRDQAIEHLARQRRTPFPGARRTVMEANAGGMQPPLYLALHSSRPSSGKPLPWLPPRCVPPPDWGTFELAAVTPAATDSIGELRRHSRQAFAPYRRRRVSASRNRSSAGSR